MRNFVVAYSGRSFFVSLSNTNILEVDSSGGGSVTQFEMLGNRQFWYRTDGSLDVSATLTDHKRHQYWDFLDLFLKAERDEEDDNSCYYYFVIDFDFRKDGFLNVTSKLLDGEDLFLLKEELVFSRRYYGEKLEFSLKHPYSADVLHISVISDINK